MKNLLFLLLCLATCVEAADLRGRVAAVSDGDTVTVLDVERTFFIVLADIRQGLGEMRVGHVGHGDQEVVREVHWVHVLRFLFQLASRRIDLSAAIVNAASALHN